jgi:hypothetical protein
VRLDRAISPSVRCGLVGYAQGILSLTAGQAVMSFEHNTREATWNKMMQEEGERQESWLAAWAEHGVGVWVDSEMLRQREDSEWRRWETKVRRQPFSLP